jgi:hypothetical protein
MTVIGTRYTIIATAVGGLETLGAPVFEIGFDRLHVALEVVH